MVTGSKRKVYALGVVTKTKKQVFLIIDDKKPKGKLGRPKKGEQRKKRKCKFNSKTTIKYLYTLKNRFGKFVLFWDKAGFHTSKDVIAYLRRNRDCIRVVSLPTAAPELNPVEECWRQGKGDISGSVIYDTYEDFKKAVMTYYKYRKFNLDVGRYLCH